MFEFGLRYSGRVVKIYQQSDDHSQIDAASIVTFTIATIIDGTL
jgi:hypothetical protein